MADDINTNNSASEVVTTLNSNYGNGSGIELIATSDSAEEFVRKVNANFETIEEAAQGGGDGVFPAHTILVNDIGDFKAGEDIGGVSIADFITYGINGQERTTLRFLHVSDTHGVTNSLLKVKELMDGDEDIAFALHTGDIVDNSNGNTTAFINAMSNISPLLAVLGNHDSGGFCLNSQSAGNTRLRSLVNAQVEYGGEGNAYWHKDFQFSDFKIRFIALDQFEVGESKAGTNTAGTLVYSQAQLNWLAARLKEMNADDYVVMILHVPPLKNANSNGPVGALRTKFAADGNIASRLFFSDVTSAEGTNQWTMGDAGVEAAIVDAYLHKKVMATTTKDISNNTIYLNATNGFDFSQSTPCHFLFHICGHLHWDVHTWLEPYSNTDYSDQLMLAVASSNSPSSHAHGDIRDDNSNNLISIGSGSPVFCLINDITIDFSTQRTVIKRIGARTTISTGTLATSRYRDGIYFPFERKTE